MSETQPNSQATLTTPPRAPKKMAEQAGSAPRPIQSSHSAAGGGMFTLYKPNQGSAVRWCSAVGLGLLAFGLCKFTYDQLAIFRTSRNASVAETVQLVVPAILAAVLAYLIFWFVGRNQRTVDFMIATEGEMKKVNWSTRKEVLGATRVVIFFVLSLGFLLFAVDLVFMFLFETIGVLKTDTFKSLFGGG